MKKLMIFMLVIASSSAVAVDYKFDIDGKATVDVDNKKYYFARGNSCEFDDQKKLRVNAGSSDLTRYTKTCQTSANIAQTKKSCKSKKSFVICSGPLDANDSSDLSKVVSAEFRFKLKNCYLGVCTDTEMNLINIDYRASGYRLNLVRGTFTPVTSEFTLVLRY